MITPATSEMMRTSLENSVWGHASLNGRIHTVFCPVCSAAVPFGVDTDLTSDKAKRHHIDFHATQQGIIFSLHEQITDLKKELRDAQPDSR